MAEFHLRGRIEAAGDTGFVAKLWLCPADAPTDVEAGVRQVCQPCSLEEIRQECRRFIAKMRRELEATGHVLREVRIEGL